MRLELFSGVPHSSQAFRKKFLGERPMSSELLPNSMNDLFKIQERIKGVKLNDKVIKVFFVNHKMILVPPLTAS